MFVVSLATDRRDRRPCLKCQLESGRRITPRVSLGIILRNAIADAEQGNLQTKYGALQSLSPFARLLQLE